MRSSSFLNSRRNNPAASRLSAENRLGLPRPSLDSMRSSRGNRYGTQPQSEAETDYDSYNDEEDDELEAEALLSRRHGEAAEADGGGTDTTTKPNKKRGASATDQDIADEYAKQEKERKTKVRRNVHRTITPDDLIKTKGLTVVRNGIAPRFHSDSSESKTVKYSNTTRSMAKYSRRLMSAYADWMDNMTSGLTLYETQWKLRSLGSKTQIKQYLTDMRNTVRDDHVERLLGLEKAESLLGQLEHYYHDGQDPLGDVADHETYDRETEAMEGAGGSTTPSLLSSPAIVNPYANSSDAHSSAVGAQSVAITPTANAKQNDQAGDTNVEEQQQKEDPLQRRLSLQKEHRARRHVLEDSDDDDDEEEAVFDDVVPATTRNVDPNPKIDGSSSPARSAMSKAARRHVLDDDSDDDDGDDDVNVEDDNVVDDSDEELKVAKTGGDVPKDCILGNGETLDGAAVTESVDQPDNRSDADEIFTTDSEIATTPTTNSSGSIVNLDEKVQSVKALLEGGDQTTKAPPARTLEETAETAPPMEEETDATIVHRVDPNNREDNNPEPVSGNNDENPQQKDSLSMDGDHKTEDDGFGPQDQQVAKDSMTETGTASETIENGDEQAAVADDGH